MRQGRYIGQFRPAFSRLHEDRDLYWAIPFAAPLVLAVCGARFAGVTTVLRYLSEHHGFRVYTLGGQLRQIAEGRGVPIESRRYLQDLGDELRTESQDAAYLARVVGRQVRLDGLGQRRKGQAPVKIAIGGLKHPCELAVLQRLNDFHLAIMNAERVGGDVRYARVRGSGMLRGEYERDRERRRLDPRDHADVKTWTTLTETERRAYFEHLDRTHREGNSNRFPPAYRGRPGEVINQAGELVQNAAHRIHLVDNTTDQIDDLYRNVDAMLDELRPTSEVVRRGMPSA